MAEPVEGLEEVLLDDSKPDQTTRIGTLVSPPVHQALTTFLKENQDVFAGVIRTCPELIHPS